MQHFHVVEKTWHSSCLKFIGAVPSSSTWEYCSGLSYGISVWVPYTLLSIWIPHTLDIYNPWQKNLQKAPVNCRDESRQFTRTFPANFPVFRTKVIFGRHGGHCSTIGEQFFQPTPRTYMYIHTNKRTYIHLIPGGVGYWTRVSRVLDVRSTSELNHPVFANRWYWQSWTLMAKDKKVSLVNQNPGIFVY